MRVAKRHIGNGNLGSDFNRGVGNIDLVVGQGRAPDSAENWGMHRETGLYAEPVTNLLEGFALATLRPLAVIDVQGGGVFGTEVAHGHSGADGGVHASA